MSASIQTSAPNSEMSSWQESPLFHLTRLCVIFSQQVFNSAPKGCLHWDEDETASEIIIGGSAPIHTDTLEKRPCVVAVRSQCGWAGIGLDQMRDLDIKTGARVVTDMISGNMTMNCISRVEAEADQIAWVLSQNFWVLRYVLLKLGFHDIGQRIQVLAPSPPGQLIQGDTEGEMINVPVVIPFHFQHTVTVQEQGLDLLKKMEMTLATRSPELIRPTNMRTPWGTALIQVDGNPTEHQNIKGRVNHPAIRGRPLQPVDRPDVGSSPLSIEVKVD